MEVFNQMTEKKRENDLAGHSGKNVPFDLSKMSPEQRARLSALIEVHGEQALRSHLIGAIGEKPKSSLRRQREVPLQWNVVHVMDRITEAYAVLSRLPVTMRPKGYGSAMPAYTHDRYDHNAQMETGEFVEALEAQNRVRLPASPAEITRMSQAFEWTPRYLKGKPEVSKAVGLGAQWEAIGADLARRCKARGISPRTFFRRRTHGIKIITMGLIRDRVPVT